MKRLIWILLGTLCILVLSGSIKRMEKRVGVTVTPEKLQLIVNQETDPYTVKVTYTLNIPANYISPCARLVFRPYFLAADHQYDLTPLVISSKTSLRQEKRLEELTGKQPDYPQAMHLESNGDGMKIKLSEVVPFEVWMAQSKLRAEIILEACDREKDISVLTLADGVIWFPEGPGPELVKYVKEESEVQKTAEVYFIYPLGYDLYNEGYDGNATRKQTLMQWVDSFRNHTGMHLEKAVITGYSSPVGSFTYNEWLAKERAARMKQWLVEKGINAALIQVNSVSEDWDGLRQAVQQTKGFGDKEAVLRILNGNYTDMQRKTMLRKLPGYEYLRMQIFPDLQKVTCLFYYTQKEEVTKVVPL